eukprot:1883461-Heterocapsa_arctica.AAC.1
MIFEALVEIAAAVARGTRPRYQIRGLAHCAGGGRCPRSRAAPHAWRRGASGVDAEAASESLASCRALALRLLP